MDRTRLLQLACRGAAELPNDPYKALAGVQITEPRKVKLTRRQREQAMAQAAAWDSAMVAAYRAEDS